MAQMMRGLSRYEHGSPPQDERIEELENRVRQLEDLVGKLMKSKNPSFMDFKFIKEEDKREEEERQRLENHRRVMSRMNALFR